MQPSSEPSSRPFCACVRSATSVRVFLNIARSTLRTSSSAFCVQLLVGIDAGMERHRQDRPVAPIHDADLVLVRGVEHRIIGPPRVSGLVMSVLMQAPTQPQRVATPMVLPSVQQRLEGRLELVVEGRIDVGVVVGVELQRQAGRAHAGDPRHVGGDEVDLAGGAGLQLGEAAGANRRSGRRRCRCHSPA